MLSRALIALISYFCINACSVNDEKGSSEFVELADIFTFKMKHLNLIVLLALSGSWNSVSSQSLDRVDSMNYGRVLDTLETMLSEPNRPDFAKAVFLTEQAYLKETVSYEQFLAEIRLLVFLAEKTFQQQISSASRMKKIAIFVPHTPKTI